MKRLNGTKVIVSSVENQNGYQVHLERADGGRYLNAYGSLTAAAYEVWLSFETHCLLIHV